MSNPIGTTGLVGQADCVLTLDRQRSQQKTKLFIGGNHGKEETVNVWFENMEWSLSSGEEDWQECSPGDKPILDYLRASKERLTAPEIYAHFIDKPEKKSKDATHVALNRLKEKGLVEKDVHKWFAITNEQELL